jgi:Tol biopolymer transport system component
MPIGCVMPQLLLAAGNKRGYYLAPGGNAMSPLACYLCFVAGSVLAVPVAIAQSATPAASAPHALKEKIVFVRADPSIGVSSMRSITVAESGPGAIGDQSNEVTGGGSPGGMVTTTHDAPDLQGRAVANPKTSEIALMNPDGSGVTRLRVFGSDPMLSPDGAKIVYCSLRDAIYSQIYVMNSDGGASKRVTDVKTGDACGPAWSPDGKKIAYYAFANTQPSRNPEIWLMDADGSNPKKLTDHGMDPSWSPDGRQIAYASRRDGIFQIYAMKADGSNVRRLTKDKSEDSNPAWGPAGNAIAYISATTDDRRGLFVMNPDGSEPQRLIFSKHQDFCFPSWSTDGSQIIISSLNRLGSQGIVPGEEKPRCEQWSGEYQIFSVDNDMKMKLLSDTKVMGTRPSYGRIATP